MIELHITPTAKGYHSAARWTHLSERPEVRAFDSLVAARAYLAERYGSAKRTAMYRDNSEGTARRIGWVYGFRETDFSHFPVYHWLQRDWVEVRESASVNLDRQAA
jgi:hypothetical protein